jgi:hypothetical protein
VSRFLAPHDLLHSINWIAGYFTEVVFIVDSVEDSGSYLELVSHLTAISSKNIKVLVTSLVPPTFHPPFLPPGEPIPVPVHPLENLFSARPSILLDDAEHLVLIKADVARYIDYRLTTDPGFRRAATNNSLKAEIKTSLLAHIDVLGTGMYTPGCVSDTQVPVREIRTHTSRSNQTRLLPTGIDSDERDPRLRPKLDGDLRQNAQFPTVPT